MSNLGELFDGYGVRARLMPALLTLLPLVLGLFAWTGPGVLWMSALWTLFGTTGATFALAMISRNLGREVQPRLWRSWGGSPTLQLLRHRGTGNPVLRERWHRSLEKIVGSKFPTTEEEAGDPKAADAIYEAAIHLLIEKRRDKSVHHLIYNENVNYGFCRNLYALKKIGIPIALVGGAISVTGGLPATKTLEFSWACAGVNAIFLLSWMFIVTPAFVRYPAFAYADRLLASCDSSSTSTKRKHSKAANN